MGREYRIDAQRERLRLPDKRTAYTGNRSLPHIHAEDRIASNKLRESAAAVGRKVSSKCQDSWNV